MVWRSTASRAPGCGRGRRSGNVLGLGKKKEEKWKQERKKEDAGGNAAVRIRKNVVTLLHVVRPQAPAGSQAGRRPLPEHGLPLSKAACEARGLTSELGVLRERAGGSEPAGPAAHPSYSPSAAIFLFLRSSSSLGEPLGAGKLRGETHVAILSQIKTHPRSAGRILLGQSGTASDVAALFSTHPPHPHPSGADSWM